LRRPTKRSGIIVLIAGVLALAATTAQAGYLFVIAAGVAGLLGASLITPQGLRGIRLERSGPPTVIAGDNVRVGLTVINDSKRSAPPLRLEDDHPGLGSEAFFVQRSAPGAALTASSERIAARRGVFEGGSATIVSGAPFGLLAAKKKLDVPMSLTVLPRWTTLRSFPLRDATASPQEQQHELARVGAGSEFIGLRPYRPGDPRRHVHWRSSARRDELVVKEHQEEVMGPVLIAVAGSNEGEAPDSSFEMMVSAAASIALYAHGLGHPLELVVAAPDGPLRCSRPSRSGALEFLAGVTPVDGHLGDLVQSVLGGSGRGSTAILVAPNSGRAGASVAEAMASAERSGARPLAVVADVSGWLGKKGSPGDRHPIPRGAAVLTRGGDLETCLRA
jgi:uncharacterized protein (DUF58 family)